MMWSTFTAGAGYETIVGFVCEEFVVGMEQVTFADGEKLFLRLSSTHVVEEMAVGIDALADEVEVFLHLVGLRTIVAFRIRDSGV